MTPSEVAAFLWQSGYEAGFQTGVDQGRRMQRACMDEAGAFLATLEPRKAAELVAARLTAYQPAQPVPTVDQCLASWTETAA